MPALGPADDPQPDVSEWLAVISAVLLAAVFVAAAVTKLAAPLAWAEQAAGLGVPRVVARVVPVAEAVLGAWLLVQWERRLAAIAAAVLLVAFSGLIALRLSQGQRPPCACFGSLSARPLGPGALARNAALLVVAVVAMA